MSSLPVNTIVIAAIAGRTSLLIARHLLATKPDIAIRGTVRDLAEVPSDVSSNPRVKIVQADANDYEKLKEVLRGSQTCICGYNGSPDVMLEGQKTLIDACIEERVARYIASDWCIDYRDFGYGAEHGHPTQDPMKDIATYLDQRSDKIKGVHILNGAFTEILFLPVTGVVDCENNLITRYSDTDRGFDMVTWTDAAHFTGEVACDPTAVGYLNVLGDRKTSVELAEIYGRVFGVDAKHKDAGDLDGLRSRGQKAFKENTQNVFGWAFQFFFYWLQVPGGAGGCKTNDWDRYPSLGKPTTVEEYLRSFKSKDEVAGGIARLRSA